MIARRGQSREKRGQKRARVAPFWRSRPAICGGAALLIGAVGLGGWLAWRAELPQKLTDRSVHSLVATSARLGFVVRDVFVVGRTETPKATLLNALGVRRGVPILAIDLEAARERVQQLPWVRDASVRRVLPDTVIVELVERRPLALWQHDSRFALIDETGQVILRDDVGPFSDLMVVVGEDAPANASALVQMLAREPDLMRRVKAAVRVGGRRWNVHMADGIDVKLPEQEPEQAWRRLADYQRQYNILDRPVQTLDLRFSDRLVVRPVDGSVEGKGA
ncbi:MAG: cell division protein FtsQ/DivIB [Rhodospirillales bacterium]|nr:cell division protein FtsQ/DivIB [Rhodospirillales bacterium]